MDENEPIVALISSGNDKKWYAFSPSIDNDNFKWNFNDGFIRRKIPYEFKSFFVNYKKPLDERLKVLNQDRAKIQESIDKLDKKDNDYAGLESKLSAVNEKINAVKSKEKLVQKLISLLECVPLQNSIMTELALFFPGTGMEFLLELDSNPDILCCANGVIDLKNKIFRPAKPADKCSKSTNIYYLTEHPQEILDEIDLFFYQLFRNDDLREYMWQYSASLLFGSNKNQTFTFFNGKGSNGKSQLTKLFKLYFSL
jgi:hypothetical protein